MANIPEDAWITSLNPELVSEAAATRYGGKVAPVHLTKQAEVIEELRQGLLQDELQNDPDRLGSIAAAPRVGALRS